MYNILITSGGTKIPIDTVRSITNMSNGTFGSKIAMRALAYHDKIQVHFLHAKRSKTPFKLEIDMTKIRQIGWRYEKTLLDFVEKRRCLLGSYSESEYDTFDDYSQKLFECIESKQPHIIMLAAAVSDYGVSPLSGKIRSKDELNIRMHPLPKLISQVKKKAPHACLVGFKLLSGSTRSELRDAIYNSMRVNHCDLVVGNDLADIKADNHTILLGCKRTGEIETYESTTSDDPDHLANIVVSRSIEERTFLNEHTAGING